MTSPPSAARTAVRRNQLLHHRDSGSGLAAPDCPNRPDYRSAPPRVRISDKAPFRCDALIPQDLGNDEIKPTFHLYQLQIIPEKAGGDIQLFKKKMDAKGVTQIPHFGPLYKFEILREYGYDEKAIAESCPVCEEVFNHRFTHFPVYGLTRSSWTIWPTRFSSLLTRCKEACKRPTFVNLQLFYT